MPKYEDFKVGDVWICRDGTEATITRVDVQRCQSYFRVETTRGSVTEEGTYRFDRVPHDIDLIRPKVPPIDLTKPLRFIGAVDTFSAAEIENAPEPVVRTLKQWAIVDKVDGEYSGCYHTREGAVRNCHSDQVIVELTGEYTP